MMTVSKPYTKMTVKPSAKIGVYYFVGLRMDIITFRIFLKNVVLANIVICIIGIFLYITMPYFYLSFLQETQLNFSLPIFIQTPRLISVIGSTAVGNLAAYSIPLLYLLYYKKSIGRALFYISISIFCLATAFSFQRGAWIASVVSFSIAFTYYLKEVKSKSNKFTHALILIPILYLILINIFPNLAGASWINDRLRETNFEAIYSRSSQWYLAIEEFINRPLGHGIGAFSHRAISHGYIGIPDGNYIRMLVEYGIVGTILFLILLMRALINTYRDNLYLFAALSVFVIQSIGSNVIDFPYTSCFFWFLLGYSEQKLML